MDDDTARFLAARAKVAPRAAAEKAAAAAALRAQETSSEAAAAGGSFDVSDLQESINQLDHELYVRGLSPDGPVARAVNHWNMGISSLQGLAAQPGGIGGTARSAREEREFHASGGASSILDRVRNERDAPGVSAGNDKPGHSFGVQSREHPDPFDFGMKEARKRLKAEKGQHLRHVLSKVSLRLAGITHEEYAEFADLNYSVDRSDGNLLNLSFDKRVDNCLDKGFKQSGFDQITSIYPNELVKELLQEKYNVAMNIYERTRNVKILNMAMKINDVIEMFTLN